MSCGAARHCVGKTGEERRGGAERRGGQYLHHEPVDDADKLDEGPRANGNLDALADGLARDSRDVVIELEVGGDLHGLRLRAVHETFAEGLRPGDARAGGGGGKEELTAVREERAAAWCARP